MASIDKIYVDNYKDYKEFIDFCNLKKEEIKNIFNVNIFDYLYYPDLTEESFLDEEDNEWVLVNLPHRLDYYFIKYCDIPFVVERLQVQYSETEYNDVRNSNIILEDYVYEKYKSFKIIQKRKGYHHIIKKQKLRKYNITIIDPNSDDIWCYSKYPKNRME
jgi:hypothetical protein